MARKSAAECISSFSSQTGITISSTSTLYSYLIELYNEASIQFNGNGNNIPALKKESNFPNIYNFYGDDGNEDAAFHSMIGWMFACQVAELKPTSRTNIFKIGYEFGGYKTSDGTKIYGYKFNYDPIVNRIVGGFIYAAMRGLKKPNIDAMRSEVGGSKYNKTLKQCYDTNSWDVGINDFYIDLRQFLPSAPGPYHSSYSNRSSLQKTIGDAVHDSTFKIPEVDYQIYMLAVNNYTLSNSTYKAATIQAIADCDGEMAHVLGADNKGTYDGVTIKAVFGPSVIGETIDPTSYKAKFVERCQKVSSSQRSILQATEEHINPPQYGRERPGCSWRKNETPANSSDNNDGSGRSGGTDNYNVSVNAQIDDWDGNPTGYYDANGNWVYPNDDNYTSASDYKNKKQAELWASSYPSGHSSGITGAGMLLSELHPANADKILKAVNQFAVNRTIVKYHWNSDTLIGRLLGTAGNSISHAASDYENLLNGDYSTIGGSSDDPGNNPGGNGSGSGSLPLDTERPSIILNQNGSNVTVSMASSLAVNGRETDIPWGGIGAAGTIRWKRDIIDVLNYLIKPIKDLQISGLSYNILTSYSYFHNDVCFDLKWLWAFYKILAKNYKLLVKFKQDIDNWKIQYENWKNEYDNFCSLYNSALYELNSGGPYYIKDGTTTIEIPDDETETETQVEPSTYSLSINTHNISYSFESGQKSIYEYGDQVIIKLTPDDGYKLPSYYNIIRSGVTIGSYNTTTGLLVFTITGNATITINGILEDEEEYIVSFSKESDSIELSSGGLVPILSVTVSPSDYISRGYALRYSTDDSTIATIYNDNGVYKINVKKAGSVDITCELLNGTDVLAWDSYTLDISIETHPNTYDLTITIANQNIGPGLYNGTQVSSDTPLSILYVYIRDASGNNEMIFYTSINSIYKIYLTSGNGSLSTNITKDSSGNNLTISHSVAEKIKKAEGSFLKYVNMQIGNITTTADFAADWYDDGFQYDTTTAKATLKLAVKNLYPNSTQPVIINYSSQNPFSNIHELSIDSLNEEYYKEKSNERTLNSIYKTQQDGDIIYGKTITIDNYVLATLPTFPSLPGALPYPVPSVSSEWDSSLVPIEYFTYTWDKGIPTYNMPYEYVNMTDYIAYTPNVQNVWQTLSYSMLKWKNNQVDDHPALLYEFMDFDD